MERIQYEYAYDELLITPTQGRSPKKIPVTTVNANHKVTQIKEGFGHNSKVLADDLLLVPSSVLLPHKFTFLNLPKWIRVLFCCCWYILYIEL